MNRSMPARLLPDENRLRRLDADPEELSRGLGRLVFAVLELLRELLERQAVRRVEAGSLTSEEVERLGLALLALKERLAELRDAFGIHEEDLQLPADLVDALTEGASPIELDEEG
nr:gas vesicle family protein [uncultured bacterium]